MFEIMLNFFNSPNANAMKKYKFQDLKDRNLHLAEQLKAAAAKVIDSGRYINGECVAKFSDSLAQMCSVRNAVCVSNGLDALRLIFRAYIEMGVMAPGDEVIVPGNTYVASYLAVSDNGLVPVPVDVDASTLNLDTSLVEAAITSRTRAVMIVHLYGTPCWDETIKSLAKRYNLKIVEDNAQAIGAYAAVSGFSGSYATGGLGDAAGISFYPTKNLGALGDAGAVTTNDDRLAEVVGALRNYGETSRYHNAYCGCNCRMDEIQAAFLQVMLSDLEAENRHRSSLARIYNREISNPLVSKPTIFNDMGQVWYQYVIQSPERDRLRSYLDDCGVATDSVYPVPAYKQPCYRHLNVDKLPVTERLASTVLSLPITSITSPDDAVEISNMINKFVF